MATRYITGTIGAVIGFFIGGPSGAYYGFTIGSTLGAIADPGVIRGPSLNDVGQQLSQEGGPRPIIFALSPPLAGNIIVSGPVKKIKRRKSQGKGGPKVETEALIRTYAIGVCEGPITRFVRVWKNGELIYDVSDPENFNVHNYQDDVPLFSYLAHRLSNNLEAIKKIRFYLGAFDQDPDDALEEILGVGTTPAHRGTAYMVVADDDLTDYRGAVPQYMFQVERCEGTFLTSRPYPIEALDYLDNSFSATKEAPNYLYAEAMAPSFALVSGELVQPLVEYGDAAPEALEHEFTVESGDLRNPLRTYEDAAPEALEHEFTVVSGTLDQVLITYEDAAPEALQSTFTVESGTLT